VTYARGCHSFQPEPSGTSCAERKLREAVLAARSSDVVILCMGLNPLMEGEQGDAYSGSDSGDKFDLELPACQKVLYEAVMAEGKPVIFVSVSGSALNLSAQDEQCDAVVQCFYPGAEGGNALADILFGKACPSGRLPVTFYRSTDDLPPFADYSMKNRTYRFFEGTPLYPFGYGLSYSHITEEQQPDGSVLVTNHGPMDSWHAVLKMETVPHPELTDFRKVWIPAGQQITVKF
ncbi:MAG: glycoside hydrolase family 3 C-terminal domain-containing protein, partial [Oscillospiraceae bacterium]|nr:glycoside hydrolase family 3 C-terminal domain-containing protein [Oscillospiraceae bacterium]